MVNHAYFHLFTMVHLIIPALVHRILEMIGARLQLFFKANSDFVKVITEKKNHNLNQINIKKIINLININIDNINI